MLEMKHRADKLVEMISSKWRVWDIPEFSDSSKEAEFLEIMPDYESFLKKRQDLKKLRQRTCPEEELSPFYQEPLLTREQEQHLFRKYNFYKYKIENCIKNLNFCDLKKRQLDNIDELIKAANSVKYQLVCSNVRLAAQLMKNKADYHRGSNLVNDLLGDAYVNIIRSIDYFDWRRGLKFSTYATWVLMNNFSRDTASERKFKEHFITGYESAVYEKLDTKDEEAIELEESREFSKLSVSKLLSLVDDDRKRYIIGEWFGLNGKDKRTLKDISADLGLTKERVRQLRERGIEQIQYKLGIYKKKAKAINKKS